MKKLFIIFILFCAQNIFADSLSYSVNSQLPNDQLPNNLITNIGLKPSDLTLTDAWQGSYLFSALNDSSKPIESVPDLTWVATEPLGGFLGGFLGATVTLGTIGNSRNNSSDGYEVLYKTLFGYSIGSGFGIWATGKVIEEEKGNLIWTMLGSFVGWALVSIKVNSDKNNLDAILSDLVLISTVPLVSSLVFYRFSLK